ncbi:hypothetical protein GNI_039030 [Gregarina niphandrodes]|uniref:Uncharacterized protein n=1 Tax=Gregarina niphandrodes TaxID=110365 RepID=A0A023BAE7_GRENI|nr:hypothetical protein GNI_039030 [Gregarina niphandrodes]EZG78252.1 hypothetical protein GNI_039030 [Gregarina niphandrodes]|eukprot:XP_011129377.1 hypothetical protein GNI_039030 [Gregarina niphandrodes]
MASEMQPSSSQATIGESPSVEIESMSIVSTLKCLAKESKFDFFQEAFTDWVKKADPVTKISIPEVKGVVEVLNCLCDLYESSVDDPIRQIDTWQQIKRLCAYMLAMIQDWTGEEQHSGEKSIGAGLVEGHGKDGGDEDLGLLGDIMASSLCRILGLCVALFWCTDRPLLSHVKYTHLEVARAAVDMCVCLQSVCSASLPESVVSELFALCCEPVDLLLQLSAAEMLSNMLRGRSSGQPSSSELVLKVLESHREWAEVGHLLRTCEDVDVLLRVLCARFSGKYAVYAGPRSLSIITDVSTRVCVRITELGWVCPTPADVLQGSLCFGQYSLAFCAEAYEGASDLSFEQTEQLRLALDQTTLEIPYSVVLALNWDRGTLRLTLIDAQTLRTWCGLLAVPEPPLQDEAIVELALVDANPQLIDNLTAYLRDHVPDHLPPDPRPDKRLGKKRELSEPGFGTGPCRSGDDRSEDEKNRDQATTIKHQNQTLAGECLVQTPPIDQRAPCADLALSTLEEPQAPRKGAPASARRPSLERRISFAAEPDTRKFDGSLPVNSGPLRDRPPRPPDDRDRGRSRELDRDQDQNRTVGQNRTQSPNHRENNRPGGNRSGANRSLRAPSPKRNCVVVPLSLSQDLEDLDERTPLPRPRKPSLGTREPRTILSKLRTAPAAESTPTQDAPTGEAVPTRKDVSTGDVGEKNVRMGDAHEVGTAPKGEGRAKRVTSSTVAGSDSDELLPEVWDRMTQRECETVMSKDVSPVDEAPSSGSGSGSRPGSSSGSDVGSLGTSRGRRPLTNSGQRSPSSSLSTPVGSENSRVGSESGSGGDEGSESGSLCWSTSGVLDEVLEAWTVTLPQLVVRAGRGLEATGRAGCERLVRRWERTYRRLYREAVRDLHLLDRRFEEQLVRECSATRLRLKRGKESERRTAQRIEALLASARSESDALCLALTTDLQRHHAHTSHQRAFVLHNLKEQLAQLDPKRRRV